MADNQPSCLNYDGAHTKPRVAVKAKDAAEALGAAAALASLEEIVLSPKPGLVDPSDSGSHDDMTWTTFLASASALAPFWRAQAMDGIIYGNYKPSDGLLAKLRLRGKEMERTMFSATGGVNAHKGLIFALSLLLGAAGSCLARGNYSPSAVCARAGEIIAPSAEEDLRSIAAKAGNGEPLTHGEKIFIEHGIGGIRSEAAAGFPSLLAALGEMEDALSGGAGMRGATLCALLRLMLVTEDTNVIHRAGIEFWRGEYMEKTRSAKNNFDPANPSDNAPLMELNKFLSKYRASPGGSADLLACTLFIYRSKMLDNIFIS
ncbi:MAG: triphosphoribosyl-dephospho-CoA synthase [Synergistaceae bacterium]|jgi:triphosphoribosyl-dephospho-CoA synthetase|nr:triphosphoribosyl-dephospho-CoA synthase [Synergistaceae bacterium]